MLRLIALFRRDEAGRRRVNGAGLGASHQTGWTGLVAKVIQMLGTATAEDVLRGGGRLPPPEAGAESRPG